jgi:hypothetical protein
VWYGHPSKAHAIPRYIRRNQRHAQAPQHCVADFLDHEIAGEAVCRLDDDRANAVASDPGKQLSKAGPHLYRIGAAHRSVVEPVDDHRAGSLGITLDCLPLPRLAVLSVPHVVADEVRM